ncbi:selenide, water dikinase SelD [Ancylomarina longa]|uniref:Selenide, water dikinase n=1 Tax=Ancylomarina longa TaxID=2487017 RepID=A0A434AFG4_9BACT|nr:selenide, water dikinase SelD [Ancylomarina longa]RUT73110.1 selenide, water dikinase SelD [Ancylomarina longa]
METKKLTQFSPGAGCGCKISPKDLECILKSTRPIVPNPKLIVGNDTKDDAAVYDLGNGQALISTTDFFTPIVDDPYDFGRIAATNAISDIYAMGGKPIMALAILAWPLEKLSTEIAQKVVEGARDVCADAGIQLAGGHSIDISDPVFGLSVNGIVATNRIKQNNTASPNCTLFLTKPLGIGVLTTAEKKKLIAHENNQLAVDLMCTLNKVGEIFGQQDYIKSMTDVTGFGLLGHLSEICEGSQVNAEIDFKAVPKIDGVEELIQQKCTPGGTRRNWASYGHLIGDITEDQKALLCDPQTSGGLLVAVDDNHINKFLELAKSQGFHLNPIGKLVKRNTEDEAYINIK